MRQISKAILLAIASTATVILMPPSVAASGPAHAPTYRVSLLSSLGGNNSRGNSINDLGVVAGYSKIAGNAVRHASVWSFNRQFDLGTLGDPASTNSSVPWPVKNVLGLFSGISETGALNPYGESWSCAAFFATAGQSKVCLGFVSEWGMLRTLHPFPGGYNSFSTGTNNLGRTIGWAENGVHDPSCAADSDQVLQFKPAFWDFGSGQPHALPLIVGDSSGAATAINDRGQIVGISGDCDQAQGRRTARNAVLWENGRASKIGDLGQDMWNTPMAINQRGDIVGFAGTVPDDLDASYTHAFLKLRNRTIQDLGVLDGDIGSTATGINAGGQVVGYSSAADGSARAFVWLGSTMVSLKDLAPDFNGELVLAQDINDLGLITGRAIDPDSGELKAFVATPVSGHH